MAASGNRSRRHPSTYDSRRAHQAPSGRKFSENIVLVSSDEDVVPKGRQRSNLHEAGAFIHSVNFSTNWAETEEQPRALGGVLGQHQGTCIVKLYAECTNYEIRGLLQIRLKTRFETLLARASCTLGQLIPLLFGTTTGERHNTLTTINADMYSTIGQASAVVSAVRQGLWHVTKGNLNVDPSTVYKLFEQTGTVCSIQGYRESPFKKLTPHDEFAILDVILDKPSS